jgi:hypothetical protein
MNIDDKLSTIIELGEDVSSGMLRRIPWWELTDISEVLTASIIRVGRYMLMMESESNFETAINRTTRCNILENGHLHTRRC